MFPMSNRPKARNLIHLAGTAKERELLIKLIGINSDEFFACNYRSFEDSAGVIKKIIIYGLFFLYENSALIIVKLFTVNHKIASNLN
jgi:hypothetical protein